MDSTTMVKVGTCINVFNDIFDVYIMLNEDNDPPKLDEVDAIKKVVTELLDELCTNEIYYYSKLKSLDLNCMRYGFGVSVHEVHLIRFY